MYLSLIDFSAITNPENVDEPFPKLQNLFSDGDHRSLNEIIPTITFRCIFCNESFNNYLNTWIHLKFTHNMEQPVLCFRCKQQFKITDLAKSRWRHDCNTRSSHCKDGEQHRWLSAEFNEGEVDKVYLFHNLRWRQRFLKWIESLC